MPDTGRFQDERMAEQPPKGTYQRPLAPAPTPNVGFPLIKQRDVERHLGYVPSYWENPTRLARYYHMVKSLPPDQPAPEWADRQALETAYEYMKFRNGDRPWWMWKYLPADDPGREFLRQIPRPPDDYLAQGEERFRQAFRPEPETEPEPTPEDLTLPADITPEQYAELNTLGKWTVNILRSGGSASGALIGGGTGAVAGLLAGGPIGAAAGLVGGGLLGAGLGGLAENEEEYRKRYPWLQRFPKISDTLMLLDYPAEWMERAIGTAAIGVMSGDLEDVLNNLPAAWRAAHLTYEVSPLAPYLLTKPDAQARQLASLDVTQQALLEAYEKIKAGQSPQDVYEESLERYGMLDEMNDLIGHIVIDPLNYFGKITKQPLKLAGRITGNDALRMAATAANGPIDALQRYGTQLRITRTADEIASMGTLSKWLAGFTQSGVDKALMQPRPPGLLSRLGGQAMISAGLGLLGYGIAGPLGGAISGLAGAFLGRKTSLSYLFNLTPAARAVEVTNNSVQTMAAVLERAGADPQTMVRFVRQMANTPGDLSRELSMMSLQSPEAAALPLALRDFVPKANQHLSAWEATGWQRQILEGISQVTGKDPAEVLQELSRDDRVHGLLFEYTMKAREMATPEAQAIVQAYDSGQLNVDALREVADLFIKEKIPYTPEEFRGVLYADMIEHTADWAAKWFNVQPDPTWIRMSKMIKSAQSLVLLGLNPSYFVNNAINNVVTMAARGVFGLRSPEEIAKVWERVGYKPVRLYSGVGAGGVETVQDLPTGAIHEAQRAKDWINRADEFFRDKQRKFGLFSNLSKRSEEWSSAQATTSAFVQAWGRLWRPGNGFDRMPPALEQTLARIDPNLPGLVYQAIQGGMNQKEIEAALWSGVTRRSIDSIIPEVADVMGKTEADVREVLMHSGAYDFLRERLTGDIDDAGVRQAFADLDAHINKTLDDMARRDLEDLAGRVEQRVRGEGFQAALDVHDDIERMEIDRWLLGQTDWERVYEDTANLPTEQRLAAVRGQIAAERRRLERHRRQKEAAYLGVARAVGVEHLTSRALVDNLISSYDRWMEYYRLRQERLEDFFGMEFADAERRRQTWNAYQESLDRALIQAIDQDREAMAAVDDMFAQLMGSRYGEQALSASRFWRQRVREIKDRYISDLQEFRNRIRALPPDQQRSEWARYLDGNYRVRLAEDFQAAADAARQMYDLITGRAVTADEAAAEAGGAPLAQAAEPPAPQIPPEAEELRVVGETERGQPIVMSGPGMETTALFTANQHGLQIYSLDTPGLIPGVRSFVLDIINKYGTEGETQYNALYEVPPDVVERAFLARDEAKAAGEVDPLLADEVPAEYAGRETAMPPPTTLLPALPEDVLRMSRVRARADEWAARMVDERFPIRSVQEIKDEIRDVFTGSGVPANEIDTFFAITDARAQDWALEHGRTPAEWYSTHIAGARRGVPQGMTLLQGPGPVWFSKLEWTVANIPQETMTVDQLRAAVAKGGVKADELKWTGFDEWLAGKKGKITRREALDFIAQNKVEVREVFSDRFSRRAYSSIDYETYTLPGEHANYRELLFTLPTESTDFDTFLRSRGMSFDEWNQLDDAPRRALVREFVQIEESGYVSPHWDERNILAHVRFDERVDADGNRVLFIDEIQSDWHQAGRKQGYTTPKRLEEIRAALDEAELVYERTFAELLKKYDIAPGYGADFDLKQVASAEDLARFQDAAHEMTKLNTEYENARKAVPDAPFAKTWHELVMKRMLRWAAENDFDKVAWPKGSQAAVIEQVVGIERIEQGLSAFYDGTLPRFMNKYGKKWGVGVGETNLKIPASEPYWVAVDDAGNEVARIDSLPEDFRIGQEIGPPGTHIEPRFEDTVVSVYSVDITPEMRQSVMQGQPLFQEVAAGITNVKGRRGVPLDWVVEDGYRLLAEGKPGLAEARFKRALNPGIRFVKKLFGDKAKQVAFSYGKFMGDTEPTIFTRLDLDDADIPEALYTLSQTGNKRFGQTAVIASRDVSIDVPFGEVDRNGLISRYEPALTIRFPDALTDEQINLLDRITREEGIAAYTLTPDRKGIETMRVSLYNQDYGTPQEFSQQLQRVLERLDREGLSGDGQLTTREVWTIGESDNPREYGAYRYQDFDDWFETNFPEQARAAQERIRGTVYPFAPRTLYQRGGRIPSPYKEDYYNRLVATGLVPADMVAQMLGTQTPEYLRDIARFITEQRKKLVTGTLTPRDVAKAQMLTVASQGASEQRLATVLAGMNRLGLDFPIDNTFILMKNGEPFVRPEDFMAAWLMSPNGQRFLDTIDAGGFPADLLEEAANVRRVFGDDRFKKLNVFGEPAQGKYNLRNIGELTEILNTIGRNIEADPGMMAAMDAVVGHINGIGAGKLGFIKHMLGMGDSPTIDAVELNVWLSGQGNRRYVQNAGADLLREMAREPSLLQNRKIATYLTTTIKDRFQELRAMGIGADIDPEVFNHVMHHWIWDRAKGTETTHIGMYYALRFAQEDELVRGAVEFLDDGRAIIYAMQQPNVSTLVHEAAHIFRRDLGGDDLRIVEEWAGVENGVWLREHEEKFARGFERYLAEGVAPTPGLRAVFERFKRWLLRIYTNIVGSEIDIEITPEVRAVFDRLLDGEAGQPRTLNPWVYTDEGAKRLVQTTDDGAVLQRGDGSIETARLAGDEPDPAVMPLKSVAALDPSPTLPPVIEEGWDYYIRPVLAEIERRMLGPEGRVAQSVKGANLPPETIQALRAYLGQVYGQMSDSKLAAVRWAQNRRDAALLNYQRQYGFDNVLGAILPYQFWYTRSFINWALGSVDRPSWLANYARIRHEQDRATAQPGFPERLQRKMKIPVPFLPSWAGGRVYIDPIHQLFPFENLAGIYDRFTEQLSTEQQRAEYIIQEWIANEEVSQTEANDALKSRAGPLWERALAQARMESEQDLSNPYDFISTISGPLLPVSIGASILRGQPEKINQLPVTRLIQSLTAPLVPGGVNIEGPLRRAAGIPERGEWWDYYVDRMLAGMAAEGYDVEEVKRAMVERQGPLYTEALRRVGLVQASRFAGSALWLDFFPEGEEEQRKAGLEFSKAVDSGDPGAVAKFFEKHPEYQAKLLQNDWQDPEQRLRAFLRSEIWQRYNALPDLHKRQVRDALGEAFTDAFLNKETRSYNAIDTPTLTMWAQVLGGYVPEAEGVPEIPYQPGPELAGADVAAEYQRFVEERERLFPGIFEQQDLYYGLPEDMRGDLGERFGIDEYNGWRWRYFADHPEIIPYATDQDTELARAPLDVQQKVYDFRATRYERYGTEIFAIQDRYFSLGKQERREFLKRYPILTDYWDWRRAYISRNPEIEPYVTGGGGSRPQPEEPPEPEPLPVDISTFPSALVRQLIGYYTADEILGAGARKQLALIWEQAGRPGDNMQDWIDNVLRLEMVQPVAE